MSLILYLNLVRKILYYTRHCFILIYTYLLKTKTEVLLFFIVLIPTDYLFVFTQITRTNLISFPFGPESGNAFAP